MNRVFVLDPGLTKRSGHNYEMAARVAGDLSAKEIDCRIFSHRDVSRDLHGELPLTPVFTQSHYEQLSSDPFSGPLDDFHHGGRKFARELAAIERKTANHEDLFFLPTAGPRELWGLTLYLQSKGLRSRVAALFHRAEPPGASLVEGTVGAAIYRFTATSLKDIAGSGRLLVGATNDYLARKLSVPMGIDVQTLPVPVWYAPLRDGVADSGTLGTNAPVVTFLGHMRDNHGFELVPALVREIAARNPSAICRIHLGAIGKRFDLSGYHALHDAGLAEVIVGWLSDEAMANLFRNATVLVLPYDRTAYREMISGVLCNAIAFGKPCVVPSGTWLADQIDQGKGSGAAYEGDGVSPIADSVDFVLRNLPTQSSNAAACVAPWRKTQSGEILVDQLIAWCTWNNASSRSMATGDNA